MMDTYSFSQTREVWGEVMPGSGLFPPAEVVAMATHAERLGLRRADDFGGSALSLGGFESRAPRLRSTLRPALFMLPSR